MAFRRFGWLAGVLLAALPAWADVSEPGSVQPAYELEVEGDRVSLRVANGELVALIEDLGRRMGFEVVATSVGDLRISDDFKALPSRDAIRRICTNVGYVEVPDPATGKIARLVLTGGGGGANRLEPRRDPLPPERPVPSIEPTSPTPQQRKPAMQPKDQQEEGDDDDDSERDD